MAARRLERHLPLDLGHGVGRTRDDLVVTRANAAAVSLVERWPDWPSPVVVLAGPPGSGKSHLAAIWRELSGAHDQGEATSAEPRIALIDDADRARPDDDALFHLINSVRQSGGALLMTSRSFPAAWPVRLPDLASRLKAATVVEIQEPDDALLEGVLAKLFADRQVDVEPHVIQFLARRIERSLATAIDVVARLDRRALALKAPITRTMAAEVIEAVDRGQQSLNF